MGEVTVDVSDTFDLACPGCNANPKGLPVGGVASSGRLIGPFIAPCPVCDGNGTINVHVEGETTVDIEPPERDEP